MPSVRRGMRLGFIEPHLGCFGGIRRMIEFANRLTARGHDVTFYLPDDAELRCTWMRCDASIAPITSGFDTPLDVVLFNSEPQWHLIERFEGARRRIFYALHYACLYDKEGSWESLRVPVDLQLANSNWTADKIFEETGSRPVVQLGGVNRQTFHPYADPKRTALLTNGERGRSWKGTETVLEAARLAGVRAERYAGKNLDQHELGRRYARARVFAVGSWFEGFCQPGLESLACGTALVTTDNGGCREYAIDNETALVVPIRDAPAMAHSIRRLLDDPALARRLVTNGLEIVARDFDWERRTDEFAAVLDGVCAGHAIAPNPRVSPCVRPELSIVVRGGDLRQTQMFIESVRRHTDVPYEIVIVNTNAGWEAENYARHAAERAVVSDADGREARAMNDGAEAAVGTYIAFCAPDAVVSPEWASRLLATAHAHERAAVVVPATSPSSTRDATVLAPFSDTPTPGLCLVRRDVFRQIRGWDESYETGAIGTLDLCFRAWVDDFDVVRDHRVEIRRRRLSKDEVIEERARERRDRQHFVDGWTTTPTESCAPTRVQRSRNVARGAAAWMARYWELCDREYDRTMQPFRKNSSIRRKTEKWAHKAWRNIRPRLPVAVADRLGAAARRRLPD